MYRKRKNVGGREREKERETDRDFKPLVLDDADTGLEGEICEAIIDLLLIIEIP